MSSSAIAASPKHIDDPIANTCKYVVPLGDAGRVPKQLHLMLLKACQIEFIHIGSDPFLHFACRNRA